MTNRFRIECNGIIDDWRLTNTGNDCKDILTWNELCKTLNQLNKLADKNLDEYQLIVELEDENRQLKEKLKSIRRSTVDIRYKLQKIIKVVDNDE